MSGDLADLGFNVNTGGLTRGVRAMRNFSRNGREMEDNVSGNMSRVGASVALVGKVALTAVAGVAALASGLTAMQISAAKSTRELSLLSAQAKLSAQEFDSFSFATNQFGINSEQIADISKDLADKLGEYATAGTGTFQDYADAMGLTQKEAVSLAQEFSALSSDKVIGRIVAGLESVNASANTTTFVLESMGNDLSKLSPLFLDGSEKLNQLRSRFDLVNKSMALTGGQADNLKQVGTTFDLLTKSFSNASIAISASLAPQFDSFFNAVISIVPRATNTIIDFINSFKDASNIESITSLESLIKDQETKINRLTLAISGYTQAQTAYNFTEEEKASLLKRANEDLVEATQRQKDLATQLEEVRRQEEALAKTRAGGSFTRTTAATPAEKLLKTEVKTTVGATQYDGIQSVIDDITSATTIGKIAELNNQLALTQDFLEMGLLDENVAIQRIGDIKDAIEDLSKETDDVNLADQFEKSTDAISGSLSAMRDLTAQGTSAYNKLSTAMAVAEAVQAAMAIKAAVTMATITGGISAVVSLVAAISTLGGDLSTTFEATQEVQGLNQWGEKASSISDATEATANATEDLVGINTDMLDALTTLKNDVLAASGIVQKDLSSAVIETNINLGSFFDNASNFLDKNIILNFFDKAMFGGSGVLNSLLGFGPVFDVLGSLFGGSSKVTDSGIAIAGGTLGDLIDETVVRAYQDSKSKKYAWSSSKKRTDYAYLSDASAQFALVFDSLADSVFAAGSSLGLTSEYLEDAINSFVISSSEISTRSMSSDEINEEIEAYFSNLFSELSISIVPYLSDFQETGEELSGTLVRLANEVSLLEYASDNLGFSLGTLNKSSLSLVTAATSMSDLIGGTEAFSDAVSGFINDFASDEQILSLYSDALSTALTDVGLALPTTADGMWNLMQSLDASSDAGLEQIATLLSLSDVSSEYYDLLEDANEDMADLSDTFASAVSNIYGVTDATKQMSIDSALAAARMGDFSLAEMLDVSDYTLDTANFGSLADYNVAQAEAANKLMQLSNLAANEAGDVETEQLNELKAINASIIASINETNALLKAQNRVAINTSDYLDEINNKTSYAA